MVVARIFFSKIGRPYFGKKKKQAATIFTIFN